jgi:hypothetical protein
MVSSRKRPYSGQERSSSDSALSDCSSSSSSSSPSSAGSSSSSDRSVPSSSSKRRKPNSSKLEQEEESLGRWIDGEYVVDLETDKSEVAKLKVRVFKGKVYIDIRKYYDNGTKPTPKGVSLSTELFEKLIGSKEVIEEGIDLVEKRIGFLSERTASRASVMRENNEVKVSIELDKSHQVTVSKFKNMTLVDIRSFFNGSPTKKGICLKPEVVRTVTSWKEWKNAVSQLTS